MTGPTIHLLYVKYPKSDNLSVLDFQLNYNGSSHKMEFFHDIHLVGKSRFNFSYGSSQRWSLTVDVLMMSFKMAEINCDDLALIVNQQDFTDFEKVSSFES